MSNLPEYLKLTSHARERLEERNKIHNIYNVMDLMKSSCKWYTIDDLIPQSALYIHGLYVCRKAKEQMKYITDGNIEVLYNSDVNVAITVMEVKEKFLPITQYIKPEILKVEKENEMKKIITKTGTCPDCGRENMELATSGQYEGLCKTCRQRKQNSKHRNKEYIPYLQLSEKERKRIDNMVLGQVKANLAKEYEKQKILEVPEIPKTIPVIENYYQVKAENNPAIAQVTEKPIPKKKLEPLSDQVNFINILRECGCEISDENLKEVLDVLVNTDKLKDIFMTIAKSENQKAMLDLEQALNVGERKLQHDWEYNGFQEADDIKFKGFLTWRRVLKGAIFFWKKLYQTNSLIEMQRAWNAYTQDPNDKILLAGDKIDSTLKRFQITTESISTIFNTRKPFTRIFYAEDKESAYDMFVKWMADRQLHENKSKTTITELKNEGEKNG